MSSSPTPSTASDSTPISSTASSSSDSDMHDVMINTNTTCKICQETYTIPKVLGCFHSFCQACLENKACETTDKVKCPDCKWETPLGPGGVQGLLTDYAVTSLLESSALDGADLSCTGCKSKESVAVARCFDCANFLCGNCVKAHKFMHCFEGHRLLTLGELQGKDESGSRRSEKRMACLIHRDHDLRYFCQTCSVPICKMCTTAEHSKGHEFNNLGEIGWNQVALLNQLSDQAKLKASDLRGSTKTLEHSSNRLQIQYHKAQNEINETFNFYKAMLEERKAECLKELESVFKTKQVTISSLSDKMSLATDQLYQGSEFIDKLVKHASVVETLMFTRALHTKLEDNLHLSPDVNVAQNTDIEFVSNFQAIQVAIRNTFGYIRQGTEIRQNKTQPISRPPSVTNGFGIGALNGHVDVPSCPSPTSFTANLHDVTNLTNGMTNGYGSEITNGIGSSLSSGLSQTLGLTNTMATPSTLGSIISHGIADELVDGLVNGNIFEPVTSAENLLSASRDFPSSTSLSVSSVTSPYERWSSGGLDMMGGGPVHDVFSTSSDPVIDLTSKLISANIYPPKSQIKRQKMIYHCKFGEFGVMEGQFTEPSGVAVNAQGDIVVADTNNHRIQIFDREGRFKFQFGECGKRDGQLLYPNRVAVVRTSGDIIVTERSPTHQVQIYNHYGQFVRKFGANILQHPRGVTVDNKGRIIIVECKVMRVIIFDQSGNVLNKFGCSRYLEFPNGVVVNDKEEIFISDNRAHCVKVFSYQGAFLRQIGGEGITNYPIGVGINAAGEVLIADNHNNFNLSAFTQDGQLLSALESKVKHAQCFDVALMDEGSIVLASKDYRLYVYRYAHMPALGL